MKPYIPLLFILVIGTSASAQKLEFQADIVSQNIWRGAYLAGASIQPSITTSKGYFELTVWGSTALCEDEYEVDVILSYSLGDFSVGITDYWSNAIKTRYGKGHQLEFSIAYVFPKAPLTIEWNTALDSRKSSYAEACYHKQVSEIKVSFSVGLTPWSNEMIETDSFAFTKLGIGVSKKSQTKNISFAPSCSLIYNSSADQLFLLAGIKFLF